MAHEIESMFFVGKTPWHGLGVKVDPDITITDALKASGLDWFVNKEQLITESGLKVPDNFATVRELPNYKIQHDGFYESKSGERSVLGIVGSRYEVYQNWEAFKWFEPYLESKLVQLHTAGSLQNGRRVWILAKVNGFFTVAKNDDLELYLLLSHSHDGSLQVDVGTTPIRVVCANTLRLAHHDKASKLFKVKHGKNVAANVESMRANINLLIHGFETSIDAYQQLASTQMTEIKLFKYLKKVFDVEDKKLEDVSTRTKNQMDRVMQLFDTGLGNNLTSVQGSLWAAYNAVTQWLSYERGNSQDTRLNSLWFGDSAKLNQRALNCALSFNE